MDYDTGAPLYAQVKQRLAARIAGGDISEGDFLPAEQDLCTELGVSRITLRRAVKELCDEGLLIRQQGRGTVVARQKMQQALVSLTGFSDIHTEDGRRVEHHVLSAETEVADPAAQAALGVGARLARVLRLITLDTRPLTLETLFIDLERLPGILDPVAAGASFFQTLRRLGGPEPASAARLLNVGFATPAERRHLSIGPTQPVYRMDKTVLDANEHPIAWSRLVTPTHLVTYALRG